MTARSVGVLLEQLAVLKPPSEVTVEAVLAFLSSRQDVIDELALHAERDLPMLSETERGYVGQILSTGRHFEITLQERLHELETFRARAAQTLTRLHARVQTREPLERQLLDTEA